MRGCSEPCIGDHRFGLGVVDVGRQEGPTGGQLVAHDVRGDPLAPRGESHLLGDLAGTGVAALGETGG